MSWVKLDDQFADHPKVERAGPVAAWLHVVALCYCARHLTDGRVPASTAKRLIESRQPQRQIDRLVEVGLWEIDGSDYVIHDYLDWQPSSVDELAKRDKDRRRKASGRTNQGRDPDGRITSDRIPNGIPPESEKSPPVPSPSPSLTTQVVSPTGQDPPRNRPDDDEQKSLVTSVAEARGHRIHPGQTPSANWLRSVAASLDATACERMRRSGMTPADIDQALDDTPRDDSDRPVRGNKPPTPDTNAGQTRPPLRAVPDAMGDQPDRDDSLNRDAIRSARNALHTDRSTP